MATDTLAGFPFWKLQFDESGDPPTEAAAFLAGVPAANLTDLFVFSHGWNNDPTRAMALYTGFFGEMRKIVNDASVPKRRNAKIGLAGIVWPSILFPDDADAGNAGGAASFELTTGTAALASELPKVFVKPEQQQPLQELIAMLDERAPDNSTLLRFRDTLARLVSPPATVTTQDNIELMGLSANDDQWLQILDSLGMPQGDDGSQGGAADFGSFFERLWNGAKSALRGATYYEMKNRAGVIGKNALGPLLGQLHAAAPDLNVHLLGHSFGARLVSYSLAGLPSGVVTPIKSLFLLQGAFSHFAFADALPFDTGRKGDLAGMAARVDGPLLTTFTLKDLAVGSAYPIASVIAGQDASDASDLLYRWEGMGHDGAQAVNAAGAVLGGVKTSYQFQKGKWMNLDGNQIIVHGDPPSGAHGDIVHPETAWAALAAAGIG